MAIRRISAFFASNQDSKQFVREIGEHPMVATTRAPHKRSRHKMARHKLARRLWLWFASVCWLPTQPVAWSRATSPKKCAIVIALTIS